MKKLLSLVLVTILVIVFAGCGGADNNTPSSAPDQSNGSSSTEGIVKLGLGQQVSIAKSKSVEGDKEAVAQVDTVMAAVGFDKDGKIASITIDTAQTRVNFDKNGNLTSDPAAEQKTKVELGDGYGMKKSSEIGKEWYEQISELEKWMLGKTVDEIKNMKTKDNAVPDDPELTSLITISVQDYINVVSESFDNAK